MSKPRRKRMCVCCGEYYFMIGEPSHVSERMCASCVTELDEWDGPEWYAFLSDVEKVLEREASFSYGDIPYSSVEELIDVMDH